MRPGAHADELLAFAWRLSRVASRRRMLRVAGDEARLRLGGTAMAVYWRDRRRDAWTLVAGHGSHGGLDDALLFTDPRARDPKTAVTRLARPFRPHERLAGGLAIYRPGPVFSYREAARLGRFSRIVSAELESRQAAAVRAATARLYRKLAEGVRPIDVLYHGLDAAAVFTRADHSLSVLAGRPGAGGGACPVVAEKLLVPPGRSARIGRAATPSEPIAGLRDPAEVIIVGIESLGNPIGALVVRSLGGDSFDSGDAAALRALCRPLGLALSRLASRSR
ncbi:MAG: hypothetical protein OEQ13_06275 [Acidobacteriota bacterium]|nr:hypothetical protein [Acidobacteriota bacterium]